MSVTTSAPIFLDLKLLRRAQCHGGMPKKKETPSSPPAFLWENYRSGCCVAAKGRNEDDDESPDDRQQQGRPSSLPDNLGQLLNDLDQTHVRYAPTVILVFVDSMG
jgi:hypothetical protein